MPDSSLDQIKDRQDRNDPVEVRNIPGTDITLRVLGYVMGGNPVIHGDDARALSDWMQSRYKCHWCCDTRRVFTHGEHLLTAEERAKNKIVGDPCPSCVPKFSRASFFYEAGKFSVQSAILLRGMFTAYLHKVISPRVSFAGFEALRAELGYSVALDGKELTLAWDNFENVEEDGRTYFVDNRGNIHP